MKYYNPLFFFVLCISAVLPTGAQQIYYPDLLIPMNIPINLSANFGEYRTDHFHSGIDFKTNKQIGIPVVAVADGYISRIKIQSAAYGKTLYINHPNGLTSVYAHLNNFIPNVEKYTRSIQYSKRTYEFDNFPETTLFVFKKGDTIAFSGNTGNSSGPHLHFEIRNTKTEKPQNPLFFYNTFPDFYKPVVNQLVLYEFQKSTSVFSKKYISVSKKENGFYRTDTILIGSGRYGLGIESYAYMDNPENVCNVYYTLMMLDNDTLYSSRFDEFSFEETRFINSFLDYSELYTSRRQIQKMFVDPNNHLSIYEKILNRGVFEINDSSVHTIKIFTGDYRNQETVITAYIKRDFTRKSSAEKKIRFDKIMPCNQVNTFKKHDVYLEFPRDAFYDTVYFTYSKQKAPANFYSSVHVIHNPETPVHKKYKLSIAPESLPEEMFTKALICYYDKKGMIQSAGGYYENGMVTAYTNVFGKFFVMADTIRPSIRPLSIIKETNRLKTSDKIEFEISDNLSGISSYNGYINGTWVLFEYDKKNNLITHYFDEKIKPGIRYDIKLIVSDNKNNEAVYIGNFMK